MWKLLALALCSPPLAAEELPVAPATTEHAMPTATETDAELLGMLIAMQFRGPALRERAERMSDAELIAGLAAHYRRAQGRTEPAGAPAAAATGDAWIQLFADPDAMAALDWLPADRHAPAHRYFEDWQSVLKLRGRDAEARLDVEPIAGLLNITIPAIGLGDYQVVEAGTFSEKTLIAPPGVGDPCCRILVWAPFGKVPVGFPDLHGFLVYEWIVLEMQASTQPVRSTP